MRIVLMVMLSPQALPFALDTWNETGSYRRMVESCEDEEGVLRCFYKVRALGGADHGIVSCVDHNQVRACVRVHACVCVCVCMCVCACMHDVKDALHWQILHLSMTTHSPRRWQ